MRVPVLGTVDWKWLIIGIVFAMFVLPTLLRVVR